MTRSDLKPVCGFQASTVVDVVVAMLSSTPGKIRLRSANRSIPS
jgi:hypothetical protein